MIVGIMGVMEVDVVAKQLTANRMAGYNVTTSAQMTWPNA